MAKRPLQLAKLIFLFNAVFWSESCTYQKGSIISEDPRPVSKSILSDLGVSSKGISTSGDKEWWASEKDVIARKSFFDPSSISGDTRQIDPVSKELLYKTIEAVRKNEWQIAQSTIERAIRLHPLDEYLWTQLAFISDQRGDLVKAKVFSEKAMTLSADNPMIQVEILNFLKLLRSSENGKK